MAFELVSPAAMFSEALLRQLRILTGPKKKEEDISEAILKHVKQLQDKLQDDEELVILYDGPYEQMRVLEISLPNAHIAIFIGVDHNGQAASMIANIDSIRLTFKIIRVEPPAKPRKIGFSGTEK